MEAKVPSGYFHYEISAAELAKGKKPDEKELAAAEYFAKEEALASYVCSFFVNPNPHSIIARDRAYNRGKYMYESILKSDDLSQVVKDFEHEQSDPDYKKQMREDRVGSFIKRYYENQRYSVGKNETYEVAVEARDCPPCPPPGAMHLMVLRIRCTKHKFASAIEVDRDNKMFFIIKKAQVFRPELFRYS